MKNRAAAFFEGDTSWTIIDTDLREPRAGEVLVKVAAADLCHSDYHTITGDLPVAPIERPPGTPLLIGGHEGAGVVVEVGPEVHSVERGDHVVMSFIPSCGRCRACVSGMQMPCDMGGNIQKPDQMAANAAHRFKGEPVVSFGLGTFSEHVLATENGIVKIEKDIPLESATLCGCGVLTGWGSAVYRAQVKPGDVVAVVGCGGIGSAAVQGARIAGARFIVAIDPVAFKLEEAMRFGATHVVEDLEAALPIVQDISWGQMADAVIMTPSVLYGDLIQPAMELVRKGGVCVATAVAPAAQHEITLDLLPFTLSNKTLAGCLYGQCNPRADIPRVLHLYRTGQIKLDEMVTARYGLDNINAGYDDLLSGNNIRGLIVFD